MPTIDARQLVLSSVRELLAEIHADDQQPLSDLDDATRLIGRKGILSSLELVRLIVNLEQQINDEYGLTLTIADERAMSQEKSPFRTIGSLADYLALLIAEHANHA